MKKLVISAVLAAYVLVPTAAMAHDPISVRVCADDFADDATNDCGQIDSDTEFEDGVYITVDGDDSDPRGDGTTDGYITVHVGGDGEVVVYCEDKGGFNHPASDTDDENGTNEECEIEP